MSQYLWCEDSGSGFQFWRAICKSLYPEIVVESKGNNSRLRKAAEKIHDDGNQYFILMDAAVDNPDVLRENNKLLHDTADKNNVHIIQIHSFELALLSFRQLEQWVFAETDELRDKRQGLLRAAALFVKLITDGGTGEELSELKVAISDSAEYNSEQLAGKLLYEITRNTGFETDKGNLGKCFYISCCDWTDRAEDDSCGLDHNRISAETKARMIVEQSILEGALERVGL